MDALRKRYFELWLNRRELSLRSSPEAVKAFAAINNLLAALRAELKGHSLNVLDRIAISIYEAFDDYEASYGDNGYSKQLATSLEEKFREQHLDLDFVRLVELASHWSNDLQDWADNILTGGLINAHWEEKAKGR